MTTICLWTLLAIVASIASADEVATTKGNSSCGYIKKGSLPFCSMVDYYAVVTNDDVNGVAKDLTAKNYYDNLDIILQRFGCNVKYSLYGCDDCRDAYKYWICSVQFPRCKSSTVSTEECTSSEIASSNMRCEGSTIDHGRTCLSICQDVVRKCPYVLEFKCPQKDTAFFSSDITTCNKLDRFQHPEFPDKPWPGNFQE